MLKSICKGFFFFFFFFFFKKKKKKKKKNTYPYSYLYTGIYMYSAIKRHFLDIYSLFIRKDSVKNYFLHKKNEKNIL